MRLITIKNSHGFNWVEVEAKGIASWFHFTWKGLAVLTFLGLVLGGVWMLVLSGAETDNPVAVHEACKAKEYMIHNNDIAAQLKCSDGLTYLVTGDNTVLAAIQGRDIVCTSYVGTITGIATDKCVEKPK